MNFSPKSCASHNRFVSSPDVTKSAPLALYRATYIEEIISEGSPRLTRQFSYEQMSGDRIDLVCTMASRRPSLSSGFCSDFSPSRAFASSENARIIGPRHGEGNSKPVEDFNDSPMEIDLTDSSSTTNAANTSPIDDCLEYIDLTADNDVQNIYCGDEDDKRTIRNRSKTPKTDAKIKSKFRNMIRVNESNIVHRTTQKAPSKLAQFSLVLIVICCGFSFYTFFYDELFLHVDRDVQLDNIRRDLQNNLVSQADPVIIVLKSLEHIDYWSKSIKVLAFIGSNGVGKTYMANLIKKHYPPKLIHEINAAHLSDDGECKKISDKLRSNANNLLILDDLRAEDFEKMHHFIKTLSEKNVKRLLTIAIFNIQETSDNKVHNINHDLSTNIRNSFANSDLYFELAYFNIFTDEEVRIWLEKELLRRGINPSHREKIANLLLEDMNVKYNGFKGLHKKLKLILEQL